MKARNGGSHEEMLPLRDCIQLRRSQGQFWKRFKLHGKGIAISTQQSSELDRESVLDL